MMQHNTMCTNIFMGTDFIYLRADALSKRKLFIFISKNKEFFDWKQAGRRNTTTGVEAYTRAS